MDYAKKPVEGAGEVWTWTASEAETPWLIAWLIGPRDGETAARGMPELQTRLANRVPRTSEGPKAYVKPSKMPLGPIETLRC